MNQDISLSRIRAEKLATARQLEEAFGEVEFTDLEEWPLAEALIVGLIKQGVKKFLAIFGHGSTTLGEMLRIYEEAGAIRVFQFRNEVEMAHAGTALRWIYDEPCAIVTSIGPGALQALAGSLTAASNGVGNYYIFGDETTFGEGYNMQQVPKPEQNVFAQLTSAMGRSYTLHTANALRDLLRCGGNQVFHPWKPGPFYINFPINMQPQRTNVRPNALPFRPTSDAFIPANKDVIRKAADYLRTAERIAVKIGGGGRHAGQVITALIERVGAVAVLSPGSLGVISDDHLQNMHVGGSKGSISGNFAMQEADLLLVVGSRGVCQSDCSGIGWPKVERVININADYDDLQHYNNTLALHGSIEPVLECLHTEVHNLELTSEKRQWLERCSAKKRDWLEFKSRRFSGPAIFDPVWQRPVLTQPQAIKAVADFCSKIEAIKLFDAGDVQANGFQIVEDSHPGSTFTDTGASYMGFAASGLLSTAISDQPKYTVAFTGDGSFMMNPQVLIDGVEHGARGLIALFDNRRMAAITALQLNQYDQEFRTSDSVAVDYVAMANSVNGVRGFFGGFSISSLIDALEQAHKHDGLSLVHIPVYHGDREEGGMGAYGDWNVGCWVDHVQEKYLKSTI
ncbi:MAG: hypothetical protein LAT80_12545 [Balneolaceae bacterium]|nr:hypothetical protein [Balneolaceae bacterium]